MKFGKRITAAFLAAALLLSLIAASLSLSAWAADPAARYQPNELNGLLVRSLQNRDFPFYTGLSSKKLKAQIQQIVDYAAQIGSNAIFFEVRPEGDSLYSSKIFPKSRFLVEKQGGFTLFDPLKAMIQAAGEKSIDVYAVVNPYYLGSDREQLSSKSPAAKEPGIVIERGTSLFLNPSLSSTDYLNTEDIGALIKRYQLAGVILEDLDHPSLTAFPTLPLDARELVEQVSASVKREKPDAAVGVLLRDENGFSIADAEKIAASCDLVLPVITETAGFGDEGYLGRLREWKAFSAERLVPVISAGRPLTPTVGAPAGTEDEPSIQIFAGSQIGQNSYLIDGYRSMLFGFHGIGDRIASMNTLAETPAPPGYAPEQALGITRPAREITVTTGTYFIMGTSDPALPLTMDGAEITRITESGTFGVLVNLSAGANTFTFQQDGRTETVVIRRSAGGGYTPSATNKITSMAPQNSATVRNGDTLALKCTAPAGAEVTASIGGSTVALRQNAAAQAGIPAVFSGTVILNELAAAGEVKNVGPVTYTLAYNGARTVYTSAGNVYLLGEGARPMVRVTDYVASVFPDGTISEGTYKSLYKRGTTEEVVDQAGEVYELASGGFVRKVSVEVVEGTDTPEVQVSAVALETDEHRERFVLRGAAGVPFTFSEGEDGKITVLLHGEVFLPEGGFPQSGLFSEILVSQGLEGAEIAFSPSDRSKIWGYDLFNSGEDAILQFSKRPKRSQTLGKPLEHLTVMLDPGHGGNDSGALGVLQLDGPTEAELNFANAQMLKMRLEQLGATVALTRGSGDTVSLYDRMEKTEEVMPDLFIALHHNSVAEASDGNRSNGVEAYYHFPNGEALASAVATRISATNAGRGYRGDFESYYTVTRMRYIPSILAEIGFVPSPWEYERVCDPVEIYKTACAISSAVMDLLE